MYDYKTCTLVAQLQCFTDNNYAAKIYGTEQFLFVITFTS